MNWELEGDWSGRHSPRHRHVCPSGERTRESLCSGEGSVWTEPVAVESGEPGMSEHSKPLRLHLKIVGVCGKVDSMCLVDCGIASCGNLPGRSPTISSFLGV